MLDSLMPGTMMTACFFLRPRSTASRPIANEVLLAVSHSLPGDRNSVILILRDEKEGKSAMSECMSKAVKESRSSPEKERIESPSVNNHLRHGTSCQLMYRTNVLIALLRVKYGDRLRVCSDVG